MTWKEDIRRIVGRLPHRFNLTDVYAHEKALTLLHPANDHVREKIRQVLQVLRDEHVIRFVDDEGTYEKR